MSRDITEKRAASVREFIFTLVLMGLCGGIAYFVKGMMPVLKIVSELIIFALGCVLAYFAITRYSSSYTYSIENGILTMTQTIGHRVTGVEIEIDSISKIRSSKPEGMLGHVYKMTPYMLPNADTRYIVFEQDGVEKAVVFAPSKRFLKALKADKHIERK